MDVQRRSVVVNPCVTVLYWQGQGRQNVKWQKISLTSCQKWKTSEGQLETVPNLNTKMRFNLIARIENNFLIFCKVGLQLLLLNVL